jgi:HlyD family secretion protein
MSYKRKIAFVAFVVTFVTAGIYYMASDRLSPQIITQPITRGVIEETVGATGSLEAVTTVQVGTQVSGTIQELRADFNSKVRKGQVITILDPSLFQTQVEQARANLDRAEADLDRLRLSEEDALRKLERARKLKSGGLIPESDFDSAEAAHLTAAAQVRSAAAQVTQARASLNQAIVSLEKTVITAPIDGIVIARNVDVGQTVAASLQAPTLFVIAADLTRMRVNANIHEADIGRVHSGQEVSFRVDAYPTEEFPGTVSLVRLNPVMQQNVVTYATVIDVSNPHSMLKPGMTATVTIRIARRDAALRAPNAALRFNPTSDLFAALGQSAARETPSEREGFRAGVRPSQTEGTPGHVWRFADGQLTRMNVLLGITDGVHTELLGADLPEGTEVVTGASLTGAAATTGGRATSTSPLLGPQPPGRGGPR